MWNFICNSTVFLREFNTIISSYIVTRDNMYLSSSSELLLQNTGLTVPILDALSNLNLRPELLAEVGWLSVNCICSQFCVYFAVEMILKNLCFTYFIRFGSQWLRCCLQRRLMICPLWLNLFCRPSLIMRHLRCKSCCKLCQPSDDS